MRFWGLIEPCIGCVTEAGMIFLKDEFKRVEPIWFDRPIGDYNPDR